MRSPDTCLCSPVGGATESKSCIGTGTASRVWSKRLEEGTYAVPFGRSDEERRREITAQELGALLSGIDLEHATRRQRYARSQ